MLERQGFGGILQSFFVMSLRIGAAAVIEAVQEAWKTEDAGCCREEVAKHYFVQEKQWSEHSGFDLSFDIQAR